MLPCSVRARAQSPHPGCRLAVSTPLEYSDAPHRPQRLYSISIALGSIVAQSLRPHAEGRRESAQPPLISCVSSPALHLPLITGRTTLLPTHQSGSPCRGSHQCSLPSPPLSPSRPLTSPSSPPSRSMTTFVQLGEQDNAFDLANVLDRVCGRSTTDQQVAAAQRESFYQQQAAEYEQRRDAGEDMTGLEQPQEEQKSELSELVLEGAFARLIDEGVLKSIDVVMSSGDADVEVVFALTFALFPRLSTNDLSRITHALLPHLTSSASAHTSSPSPFTRLRLLTQLFNLLNATLGTSQILPNLPLHSTNTLADVGTGLVSAVLLALLDFVVASEQGKQVVGSLPVLTSLVVSWELDAALLSQFYLKAYEVTKQVQGGKGDDDYLYKYMRALDKVGGAQATGLLKASRPYAFAAAHRAISSQLTPSAALGSPSSFTSSASPLSPHTLLTLGAINNLATSNSADDAKMHSLLALFATDDVDGYLAFSSTSSAFLNAHSLSHPLLLQKLRILSLCALASSAATNTLPYSTIAQRLSLTSDLEVEAATIDAIVSGRLDARIDQEKAVVEVRRVVGSVLKVKAGTKVGGKGGVTMEADWAALEKRLGGWKANMQSVLGKLSGEAGDFGEDL